MNRMNLLHSVFTLFLLICLGVRNELFVLGLTRSSCDTAAFEDPCKIAYHMVCDGDHLITLSYCPLVAEEPLNDNDFPDGFQKIDTKRLSQTMEDLLSRLCVKSSLQGMLTKHPLLPWIRVGYIVVLMDRDNAIQTLEMMKGVNKFYSIMSNLCWQNIELSSKPF